MTTNRVTFNWADPLHLDSQLNDTERMVRDTARDYCQEKLLPRVQNAFRDLHALIISRAITIPAFFN